jgi:hypothetical protein
VHSTTLHCCSTSALLPSQAYVHMYVYTDAWCTGLVLQACQVLLDLARAQQQPTTAAAEPGQGPLPGAAVRGLAGALDAANGRVRCAAAAVLVEVLGVGGSGDQVAAAAEPGESWVQVRQEALKALQGAGDVVAAAGLQAQTEALGCQ